MLLRRDPKSSWYQARAALRMCSSTPCSCASSSSSAAAGLDRQRHVQIAQIHPQAEMGDQGHDDQQHGALLVGVVRGARRVTDQHFRQPVGDIFRVAGHEVHRGRVRQLGGKKGVGRAPGRHGLLVHIHLALAIKRRPPGVRLQGTQVLQQPDQQRLGFPRPRRPDPQHPQRQGLQRQDHIRDRCRPIRIGHPQTGTQRPAHHGVSGAAQPGDRHQQHGQQTHRDHQRLGSQQPVGQPIENQRTGHDQGDPLHRDSLQTGFISVDLRRHLGARGRLRQPTHLLRIRGQHAVMPYGIAPACHQKFAPRTQAVDIDITTHRRMRACPGIPHPAGPHQIIIHQQEDPAVLGLERRARPRRGAGRGA